jgi:hypothetical protein
MWLSVEAANPQEPMTREPKVVLVVSANRTMQASLRTVVEEAGCRAIFSATIAAAQRRLAAEPVALILADPLLAAELPALAGVCPVVTFPVRTSSTGVRRMAKRNEAGVKWLTELVSRHCASS